MRVYVALMYTVKSCLIVVYQNSTLRWYARYFIQGYLAYQQGSYNINAHHQALKHAS